MLKSEQLEKLHEDYNRFLPCGRANNKDDVLNFTNELFIRVSRNSNNLIVERQKNLKSRRISEILVNIPFIKIHKKPSFYDADNGDISLECKMCDDYLDYYMELDSKLTDDNFQGIYKLAAFVSHRYQLDVWAIETNRARREGACYGKDQVKDFSITDRDVMFEFLGEAISALSSNKKIEKVKK